MAKVLNTFLKSKMNKDLDARIIPGGEYRNAVNVQVSRSEGESVGSVENVLGNDKVFDFETATGVSGLYCIGYATNDQLNTVYVFLHKKATEPIPLLYNPNDKNFIFACNVQTDTLTLLVEGAFLNFSKSNPVYGVNVLENLLFWTDNRNQPRKINLNLANSEDLPNPTYYTTEDQISVAKYNPYSCMELYQKSYLSTQDGDYESTMKDVVSKYYPNGGAGNVKTAIGPTPQSTIELLAFEGDIITSSGDYDTGASLAYVSTNPTTLGQIIPITGATVSGYSYADPTTTPFAAVPTWTITANSPVFQDLALNTEIILNPNPYYDPNFAGDPDYLEDKFSRFSYRFQFEDNEYSLIAPFTQIAFIPKQDGYFMYVKQDNISDVDDQSETYRSTVVSFMENKVNNINLRIPLPFLNYDIQGALNIKNIDILYKESDAIAIKVVDTIPIVDVVNSSGTFSVDGAVPGLTTFDIDNLQGGIQVGALVTGFGIVGKPKVVRFDPTDPNNPSTGGEIEIYPAQTLVDGVVLNVGEPDYYVYDYQSKKPFKTLPENATTRVFDKIPVKAFAQEVSGNRIIYGNYQDKHTPPESLNYNVAVSDKVIFNLNREEGIVDVDVQSGTEITIQKGGAPPSVGDFISLVTGTGDIPPGTQITDVTEVPPTPSGIFVVTLNNTVTNISAGNIVLYAAGGDTENSTSIIEYPNSSLKTNRNYQVGVVLSDRYGRTSSVLLSNNKDIVRVGLFSFSGDTIYSGYKDISGFYIPGSWPGDSLKLLFNETISSSFNEQTGTPGIYDGDSTSLDYNPLGWYSYKIVVKQTEQDYYNVYLPGIMASYPKDQTLELGKTSHVVLINDNINKVPRDLSEVGPEQRQFRSSVQLFGRVENTSTAITAGNIGESNTQYYPKRSSDTVSTISTVADLFEYVPLGEKSPRPNFFPQFYSLNSNPLVARISTNKQIGQIATTNYDPVTATVGVSGSTSVIQIVNATSGAPNIIVGDLVAGSGLPEDLLVVFPGYVAPVALPQITSQSTTNNNTILTNDPAPVANSSVTGAGIPEGTIITSVVSASPNVLTLNNVVNISGAGVPIDVSLLAEIHVDQSIDARRGNDITITSGETPGIQYLAVYETEPQESLLDIFWETSTSGLITDLNNAVINESSGGAALFGFNPTEFTEGLGLNGSVSVSDFSIVDNFGSPIPYSDITSPFILLSQENQAGFPVNYFTLTQPTPGVNSFNIQTNQDYFDSVYFFPFPALRNFNLVLQVEINGLLSNFPISLNLQNVSPTISAPNNGDVFDSQANLVNITQIEAQNGSANNAASPATGQLSKIFSPGPAKFTVVENSSGTSFLNLDGTSPLFLLQPYTNVDSPDLKVIVENNQVNEITIDRYNITVEIQDAGGQQDSTEVSFVVDYGVKVENMVTKRFVSRISGNFMNYIPNMRGPNDSSVVYQYVTDFEVTEGPAAALGWYRYNGPWNRTDGEGVDIVTEVNLQNEQRSFQNAEWSCSNGCNYSYPSGVAVGFLVDGADNFPGASGEGETGGGINIDDLNATILGRVTLPKTANLGYPLTGSRMIRALTQADLDLTWRANCKYFAGDPPVKNSPPGINGLFPQNVGSSTNEVVIARDAYMDKEYPISDAIVNQYNWHVEL
jgi:hypothetical protein